MKVKIKSTGSTGDQKDFSLFRNLTGNIGDSKKETVRDTMIPVSRDKATFEAEGGETIVGDLNNDGNLEHNKIVGPRHTEGGVPLTVPKDSGAFVFSDTKDLRIKDPEILKHFGFNGKSATPATLAKRFDINKYVNASKDPEADQVAVNTASRMLENNTKKLSELAMIQESMKGMPNGVPAIAQPLMGTDLNQSKFGGMVKNTINKLQNGGEPTVDEKTTAFNNRFGRKPETEEEWEAAYNLVAYAKQNKKISFGDDWSQNIRSSSTEPTFQEKKDAFYNWSKTQGNARTPISEEDWKYAYYLAKGKGLDYKSNSTETTKQLAPVQTTTTNTTKIPDTKTNISPEEASKITRDAINSGNRENVTRALQTIQNFKDSPWYSMAWVPGSNEFEYDLYEDELQKALDKDIPVNEAYTTIKNYVQSLETKYPEEEYRKLSTGKPSTIKTEDIDKVIELYKYKSYLEDFDNLKKGKNELLKNPEMIPAWFNNDKPANYLIDLANRLVIDDTQSKKEDSTKESTSNETAPSTTNNPSTTVQLPVKKEIVQPTSTPVTSTPGRVLSEDFKFGGELKKFTGGGQLTKEEQTAYDTWRAEYKRVYGTDPAEESPEFDIEKLWKEKIKNDPNFFYFGQESALNGYEKATTQNTSLASTPVSTPISNTSSKPQVKVSQENGKGPLIVGKLGSDGRYHEIFTVYSSSQTTPGGTNSGYSGSKQELQKQIDSMISSGIDFSKINTAEDFQREQVNYAVNTNPDAVLNTFAKHGQTIKGAKDPNAQKNLESLGVKITKAGTGYTMDFSGVKDKPAVARILADVYPDNAFGVRGLDLASETNKTVEAKPIDVASNPIIPNNAAIGTPVFDTSAYGNNNIKNIVVHPSGGFFKEDIVNLMSGLNQKINKYYPHLNKHFAVNPDVVFNDATRQVENVKSVFNKTADIAAGTMAGNTAFSNILAGSGNAAEAIANIIAQNNNANVGIANQVNSQQNITNQNQDLKDQYFSRLATLNQNYDNASNQKSVMNSKNLVNAMKNSRLADWMEALYPEFKADRTTGDITFVPSNAGGGNGGITTESLGDFTKRKAGEYVKYYQSLGYKDPEKILDMARKDAENEYNTMLSKDPRTRNDHYNEIIKSQQ